MKNKYGLILSFLFLFIAGITNAQMKADFIAQVTGKNVIFSNYTASNPPASALFYRWDFGDGSSFHYTSSQTGFSHTYSQIGNYTVTLIAVDSTGTFPNDTFSDNINIICIADFNYSIVSGNKVLFTDASRFDSSAVNSSNVDYFWLYSDSGITKLRKNDTHTFPTNGSYKIKHMIYDSTVGNTCWDSAVKYINLSAIPCYVRFKDSALTDTTRIFTVDSVSSSSMTYLWSFGDGTYSNDPSQTTHSYTPGPYTICLTVTDTVNNCSTTYCDSIYIFTCSAKITYTNVGGKYDFNPNVNLPGTTIFNWDFGDGNGANGSGQQIVSNTYATPGTYQVYMYLSGDASSNYCQVDDSVTINYNNPCAGKAAFGYIANGNKNFDFIADSLISDSATFYWTFGDGNTSTQRNPNHTFSTNYSYDVFMYFYDSTLGCRDSVFNVIHVGNTNCNAKFGFDINGKDVSFYDSSTILDSSATKYLWSFGDGYYDQSKNPTYYYSNNKDYVVTLTIKDTVNNCTSSYSDTVKIGVNCRPDFTYTVNSTNSFKYYFNDNSIVPSSNATYSWSFSSTNKDDSVTYNAIGTYYVCLTIVDTAYKCDASICKPITVVDNCNSSFKYVVNGDSVSATADTNTAYMTHYWNIGGNTYSGSSINLYFGYGTTNIICHQLIDSAKGCTSTWCDTVRIGCNLDFTYTVSGDTLKITNTSKMPSGTTYHWDFGDGDTDSTSGSQNPTHIYSVSDTVYKVSLSVSNASGCNGTINKYPVIGNLKQDIYVVASKDPLGPMITPLYAIRFYLIEYDSANQTLTAIDSADIFNDSFCTFSSVAPGIYLVKAALLPSDSDYYDYLPTYGDTALVWSTAEQIYHTNLYRSGARIHFIKGTNPGGSGFIAGYVYQGANKKEGPLENIDVYLTLKDGTPVTFAKTDIEGKYEFNNLAFGEYKLWVEIAGKPSEFYDIVLNQNTPSSMEINFDVNKDEIVKRSPNASVNNIQNSHLKLYPNPVKDFLNIKLETDAQHIEIEIYDISGSLVLKNKMNSNEKMDVSSIKTGIYYILIQTDNKTIYRQKFLKD